jgi:hypothetical protein
MNRVDTTAKIEVYEISDEVCPANKKVELVVQSHWNRKELVKISAQNGITFTVVASDLIDAIERCSK